MAERVLLIDYENIHEAGLKKLPAHDRILIFIGNGQRMADNATLPDTLVDEMMKAGKRLDLIPVTATGSNNLDFHMAFYLGTAIAENPLAEYIAVSYDDDLDPLLAHLKSRGFNCRREKGARAAKPLPQKPRSLHDSALELLKSNKPKDREALAHRLTNHFHLNDAEAEKLVAALQQSGAIGITKAGRVSYKTGRVK